MDVNDKRIQNHVEKIINTLPTENDSQNRDILIILQNMHLEDDAKIKLFDICIDICKNIVKEHSVRYNSFKKLIKIAQKFPDLTADVKFLSDSFYIATLSVTAKKSIAKMIASLKIIRKIRRN